MASQADLDQGGSFRQYVRRWLGPSIGWVFSPDDNVVPITAAGTTTLLVGTTLVTVNINGLVSVQLPSSLQAAGTVAPGALPGLSLGLPITVVDIGGYASDVNPITILPYGAELIMGLASIQITAPFGAYTLLPRLTTGGWTQQ